MSHARSGPSRPRSGPTKVVYKGKSGQWAFVGHRITGFLVFCFLLLHIVDVSLINIDPDLYDEVHELYGNILLRLFEVRPALRPAVPLPQRPAHRARRLLPGHGRATSAGCSPA